MSRHILHALGLLLILAVSLTLKQVKYANDHKQWALELDLPLKQAFRLSGFNANDLQVTHGGFASLYVFNKAGCPNYEVLSLRNTEDGIASAFRHRVMKNDHDEPVILLDGRIYSTLSMLHLYRSIFRHETGRLLGLPAEAGSFMIHPDPRLATAACQLNLDALKPG
ncbi:MAG: hypothetical protein AABY68_02660 [Pseudomonadota bacterium]